MAEVKFENVTKYYGKKMAIDDLSFTCKEGEFVSILGPTGAGKSTILKMIAGIETITSGKIYFNDMVVNDLPPHARNVSMAFETYNLYPHFDVYQNIAFPLRAPKWNFKLSKAEEREKVVEIAKFLGIDALLDRRPQALSGGQKQRVSLARALVRKPEVYLLDEPIAHLDAKLKFSTQTLLREFAVKYGSTIIYVTHDYREALALSDRMIVLRLGKIEQMDTPEEVYENPLSDFVGLSVGEPPMNLVDGTLIDKDGKTFFNALNSFELELSNEAAVDAKKTAKTVGQDLDIRLGIRSEYINISKEKQSEKAFQLPVYAITHEAESTLVYFELANTFLHSRIRGGVERSEFEIGDEVWIDFPEENTFFYVPTINLTK